MQCTTVYWFCNQGNFVVLVFSFLFFYLFHVLIFALFVVSLELGLVQKYDKCLFQISVCFVVFQ